MKQAIGLVLLVVFCSNAALADDNDKTQADGVSQSGRIVNGVEVAIKPYQFAVNLYIAKTFTCDGVIISDTHVLTAALCVYAERKRPARVLLYGGSSSPGPKNEISKVVKPIKVTKITIHPDYKDEKDFDFDLAILTVRKGDIKRTVNTTPIPLQESELKVGTGCYVVGWGRSSKDGEDPSTNLRYGELDVMSEPSCTRAWRAIFTSNMICAKSNNKVDTCYGDGGSPFVCDGRLSGIVAFINGECNGALPVVFSKIVAPRNRDFIRTVTKI
uniref:Peptidase S1 domain-containing protein n=1 Tax=Anopheles minimus TaxID=112268 RepID=A0A182W297_9DIPT